MNILVLSVSAGGGHTKTAQTLKKYMGENYPEENVEIIDWLKYINPMVDKVVIGSYMGTLKTSPIIYEKLYDIAEKEEGISDISRTINRPLALIMERLIKKNNPEVVVCTHPFPLEVICRLKVKKNITCKIVSLLTDFAPHNFWIRDGVDYYIIPHEDLIHEMVHKGVERRKICHFGIPIDENFLKSFDIASIRDAMELKDKTTLLLMGGSLGLGEMKKVFGKLLDSSLDIQLIAVCGKNKKLKEKLEAIASKSLKPVHILGYTSKIPQLMAVSDLLITKPGGLTISEAMTMKLPIAIISPIPGQEKRNAQYLMNSGMGISFKAKDYIEGIIRQLLDNPMRLEYMKEIAGLKASPNATRDTCEFLMSII